MKRDGLVAGQKSAPSLIYERNPKHKSWLQPFDPDASLCPAWSHALAQTLLNDSQTDPSSGARYAVHDGMAFAARLTIGTIWHGYPVSWSEVPEAIRENMVAAKKVTRRQMKKLFSSAELSKELDR
jgi:hypothetical protein